MLSGQLAGWPDVLNCYVGEMKTVAENAPVY
ncbi:hypothetical protein TDB9533_04207 [Thalassocella blandensis]|nr:hypothetical protein TDB9533_04207 [Thalassocella blandensis]